MRQSRGDAGAATGLLGSGTDALQILHVLTSTDARRSDSAAAAAAAAAAAVVAAEAEVRDSDEDDEEEEEEEGEDDGGRLSAAEMSGELQHIMARFKARAETKAGAEPEAEVGPEAEAGFDVSRAAQDGAGNVEAGADCNANGSSGGEAVVTDAAVVQEQMLSVREKGAGVDGIEGGGDDRRKREEEEEEDNEYLMVRGGQEESKEEGLVVEEKIGETADDAASGGSSKPTGENPKLGVYGAHTCALRCAPSGYCHDFVSACEIFSSIFKCRCLHKSMGFAVGGDDVCIFWRFGH